MMKKLIFPVKCPDLLDHSLKTRLTEFTSSSKPSLAFRQQPEKLINAGENERKSTKDCNEIPIYNYVSSNSKPLKWKEFMAYNELAEPEIPSVLAVRQ